MSGVGGMGTGGTSGVGGMGTGGTSGVGGMGTGGMSGTGGGGGSGGGTTGTVIAVASPTGDTAQWTPNTGWAAAGGLNLMVKYGALAPFGNGGLLVARRQSATPADDNELFWSIWVPGAGFTAAQKVGNFGFAKDGPAVAPHGVAALTTFLGTDNKHYYAQLENGAFGPFSPIPATMSTQAFGPSAAALAPQGAAGVYGVYAGDNGSLYYVFKSGPGASWSTSSAVSGSPVVNTITPATLVDAADDLLMFYVRQSDGKICLVKLTTPQNSFTTEEVLNANAITSMSPSVARTKTGDYIVAWHGYNGNGIYFLRGKEGAWGTPVTVETPATATSAPVALGGLSGADAEILYTSGGSLRHARVSGNAAMPATVPNINNATGVTATVVP